MGNGSGNKVKSIFERQDDEDEKILEEIGIKNVKKKLHQEDVVMYIKAVYIIGILIWLIVMLYIGFDHFTRYKESNIVILIPIIIFAIGFVNAGHMTGEIEDEMFKANYLAVGLLIVLPLLSWMSKDYAGDRRKLQGILIMAILFTMFSLLDVWVRIRYISVVKHIKSVFETISICLMIYGLVVYYLENPHSTFDG